jgi:hypothetical protein
MAIASQHTETLEERVLRLLSQWRAETAPFSSTTKITGHPAYQEIVALGQAALPFLFSDMMATCRGRFRPLRVPSRFPKTSAVKSARSQRHGYTGPGSTAINGRRY